jgi:hypothetical protein
MRKIQNANITFRVTNDLKERLTEYCLQNDCHNSVVVRLALASYLKAQRETELPRLMAPQSSAPSTGWVAGTLAQSHRDKPSPA